MKRSLYQSGWNPRGSKREWDRCSMDVASTAHVLGDWHALAKGVITESVGWFDDDGGLKALAAIYDNSRMLLLRRNSRATTVEFTSLPACLAEQVSA